MPRSEDYAALPNIAEILKKLDARLTALETKAPPAAEVKKTDLDALGKEVHDESLEVNKLASRLKTAEDAIKALPAADVHKADLDTLTALVTKAQQAADAAKAQAENMNRNIPGLYAAKTDLDALDKRVQAVQAPYTGGAGIKVDGKTISATADDPAVKPVADAVEALKENVDKIAKKVGAT